MSDSNETFFTAVGCMDGRTQDVAALFGRERFKANYADTITEAGIVGLLSNRKPNKQLLDNLKFKVKDVSVGKHRSKGVVVHGHAECAGNPVDDEQQKVHIRKSVDVVKSVVGSLPVVGIFVHRNKNNSSEWIAEEITAK
jgi:hypothetical protein